MAQLTEELMDDLASIASAPNSIEWLERYGDDFGSIQKQTLIAAFRVNSLERVKQSFDSRSKRCLIQQPKYFGDWFERGKSFHHRGLFIANRSL